MRKFVIPNSVKHRYRIFSPTGKYKGFRLKRVEGGKFAAVVDERLTIVNAQLLQKQISPEVAKEKVEEIIFSLYRRDGVMIGRTVSNSQNEETLRQYLLSTHKTKARFSSKMAKENYLRQAVRGLGEVSLLSGTLAEMQSAIDLKFVDQRQRRAVTSINALLKHIGRNERLEQVRYVPPNIVYITEEGLPRLVENLPCRVWQVAVLMAFYTGLRIGELFALERQNRKKFEISVDWQILRDGQRDLPKNGKRRTLSPDRRAFKLYDEWLELKSEIGLQGRAQASKIVKRAAKLAWPKRKEWHVGFHDLRHSYAVRAIEAGMTLEQVAIQLGNSPAVAQDHYIGFVQTSKSAEAMFRLLNPNADDQAD